MSGGVYRLRATSRLREGVSEQDEDSSLPQQFVSTTISAVSYSKYEKSLSFRLCVYVCVWCYFSLYFQCSLVKSRLSDVIKLTGDGRGIIICT